MGPSHTETHVAAILNAAWMVRHYARGGRSQIQRIERAKAIARLAAALLLALNTSQEYETILTALVDGLRPRDEQPF